MTVPLQLSLDVKIFDESIAPADDTDAYLYKTRNANPIEYEGRKSITTQNLYTHGILMTVPLQLSSNVKNFDESMAPADDTDACLTKRGTQTQLNTREENQLFIFSPRWTSGTHSQVASPLPARRP